jgi:multidrug transporter EmrE-like cation transporter
MQSSNISTANWEELMQLQRTVRSSTQQLTSKEQSKGVHPMIIMLLPIFCSTLFGVAGQLMLKHGMSQMGTLDISLSSVPALIWKMGTSPFVIGGLFSYLCGTFFWLIALNRLPLSFAYPFVTVTLIILTLAAWLLFREHIPPLRWLGVLVICTGVILVSQS